MASLDFHTARDCWRIRYTVRLGVHRRRRPVYAKTKAEGRSLKGKLELLEQSMRSGIVRQADLHEWLLRGWVTAEEAAIAFPGYQETVDRQASPTNYNKLLEAYEQYALDHSKARAPSRPHAGVPAPVTLLAMTW